MKAQIIKMLRQEAHLMAEWNQTVRTVKHAAQRCECMTMLVVDNLTFSKWKVSKLFTLSGHLHYSSSSYHGYCWWRSVKVQRKSSMTSSVWSWAGVQSPPHIQSGRAGLQIAPAARAPQCWSTAPTSPGGSWDAWRHLRPFPKCVWIWGRMCSSKAWSFRENAPPWRSDQTWKEICNLLIQVLGVGAGASWQKVILVTAVQTNRQQIHVHQPCGNSQPTNLLMAFEDRGLETGGSDDGGGGPDQNEAHNKRQAEMQT